MTATEQTNIALHSDQYKDMIIELQRSLLDLWNSRESRYFLTWREIKVRYKQIKPPALLERNI